jgi:hypothetical protein
MHEPEFRLSVIAIVAVFGLPFVGCVIWMLMHYLFLALKQWQATALVRDMVARGYTPQEIVQVCQALGQKKVPPFKPTTDVPPAKPIKQPAFNP